MVAAFLGTWLLLCLCARAHLCSRLLLLLLLPLPVQDFCAGTAEFMSPEVLLSEEYGLPSDVFSLGMIFVEMLTGQEPSPTFFGPLLRALV